MVKGEMSKTDQEILRRRLKERRLFLNMTYQDLADKTGISKSSLQRYESGGIKNLPYDRILILSDALEVRPEYFINLSEDYTAADYNPLVNQENRFQQLEHIKEFEKKAIEQITPQLISEGYSVERHSHGSIGDLVAHNGNETWHIDFLYTRDVKEHPPQMRMGKQQLLLRFGRLAVYNKPLTKYSIVVNSRLIAEQLIEFKPVHLNIDISVIILKEDGYEEIFFD